MTPRHGHASEIRSLNTVRALAAFLVLFSHADNRGFGTGLAGAGQTGVLLFFCLSGFLMGHLYLSPGIKSADLYKYGIRRFFRVYPAYAFVLIASFIGYSLLGLGFVQAITAQRLWDQLILAGHYSIFWTIPVEMKFYVFFALFMMLASLFPSRRLIALFTILFFVVMCLTPMGGGGRTNFWAFSTPFLAGIAASQVYLALRHVSVWRAPMTAVFVVALAAAFVITPGISKALFGASLPVWKHQVLMSLTMCTLIVSSCFLVGPLRPLVENRVGDFLGDISYSVYLTHMMALNLVAGTLRPWLGKPGLAGLVLVIALTILISYTIYRLVERPFMDYGRRLSARPPGPFEPGPGRAAPPAPAPENPAPENPAPENPASEAPAAGRRGKRVAVDA